MTVNLDTLFFVQFVEIQICVAAVSWHSSPGVAVDSSSAVRYTIPSLRWFSCSTTRTEDAPLAASYAMTRLCSAAVAGDGRPVGRRWPGPTVPRTPAAASCSTRTRAGLARPRCRRGCFSPSGGVGLVAVSSSCAVRAGPRPSVRSRPPRTEITWR